MSTEPKPQGYYTDKVFTPADMDAAIAKEREACAKVCEQQEDYGPLCETIWDCAAAIRARGQS